METATKKAARNVATLLDKVRKDHGDIPVQMFTTLLTIALNDGTSQQQIQQITRQSKASASRNIDAWTGWTRFHKPGPGYVRTDEDPYDRRVKVVRLTPQGERYIEELFEGVSV